MHRLITRFCHQARPVHWVTIGAVVTLLTLIIFPIPDANAIRGPALAERLAQGSRTLPLTLPAHVLVPVSSPATRETTHGVTVQSGDTLSAIFSRAGLSAGELAQIMTLKKASPLQHIHPGDRLYFTQSSDGALQSLSMVLADNTRLTIRHADTGYHATRTSLPILKRAAYAHGVVTSSLFEAASEAGLPDNLTMKLIRLFAWDIDFSHDVKPGDSFTVLYQHTFSIRNGTRDGPILAAAFKTNGQTYTAIRYTSANGHTGYYTSDGYNVRKSFLRAPVDYTRVSSGFSLHRMNPVLHYVRPHDGTDFAAPEGTPIHVTGDGHIVYRGWIGGYGNVVKVKHAGRYTTVYAHMSRFARGQHVGTQVQQNEIIGYVGQTGVATGPHVHYEFRVHGVPKNPLKVKLPPAKPIAKQYRADYKQYAASLLRQIAFAQHAKVASL